jgi:hypothetical protein
VDVGVVGTGRLFGCRGREEEEVSSTPKQGRGEGGKGDKRRCCSRRRRKGLIREWPFCTADKTSDEGGRTKERDSRRREKQESKKVHGGREWKGRRRRRGRGETGGMRHEREGRWPRMCTATSSYTTSPSASKPFLLFSLNRFCSVPLVNAFDFDSASIVGSAVLRLTPSSGERTGGAEKGEEKGREENQVSRRAARSRQGKRARVRHMILFSGSRLSVTGGGRGKAVWAKKVRERAKAKRRTTSPVVASPLQSPAPSTPPPHPSQPRRRTGGFVSDCLASKRRRCRLDTSTLAGAWSRRCRLGLGRIVRWRAS